MTSFVLYRDPVVLDHEKHRQLKLTRLTDHSAAAGMHATFLAAAEFNSAAHDFVIVFVRNSVDGRSTVEPLALLGVTAGENLFVDGTRWDGRYVPAFIRRYPFWITQPEGRTDRVMMFDQGWPGFSETAGDPLYEPDGSPAPRLIEAMDFTSTFQVEAERTYHFCQRLDELGLLREISATLRLADGAELALEGLLTVDDTKLQALTDAQVVELHRNGILGLVHAHLLSLNNLQGLVDRKSRRLTPAAAP